MTSHALAMPVAVGAWRTARRSLVWLLALVCSALVLLAPAVWNGFPLMFYDTGAYIELAIEGGFWAERSVFYAWFLAAFWPSFSLWPAMVAQVSMTVLVMAGFARNVAPGLSPGRFFGIVVALGIGTGLPWYAGQVLPDILAPLLALVLYLLGFHAAELGRAHKGALIAVAILAATSHASHLGLAAGLAAATLLMQVLMRHAKTKSVSPSAGLPMLVFALSLLLLVASNFAHTGEVFVSRSGAGFVFGRLVQDGIVQRLLNDTCPGSGYKLCAYKDDLPKTANDWLWGGPSPFNQLGGFDGTRDETRRMIADSLKRYPLLHLKTAISSTFEQLIRFETGDGIEPLNDVPLPTLERLSPHQVYAYKAARQQDGIAFRWINALQVPVGAFSMVALAAILVAAIWHRKWDDRLFLPGFLLLALLGNAFICGALSNPHDRYQSRLIWVATFTVLLLGRRWRIADMMRGLSSAREACGIGGRRVRSA